MNKETLKQIGTDLVIMSRDYEGGPQREMLMDFALYAYLRAGGRRVKRQYHTKLPGYERPARIDFRVGGPNPVLIEFAVRPPTGGVQLYGSQNSAELRKLTRFDNNRAKLRALLLLDLYRTHLEKGALKASYDKLNAGPGKFKRSPIQVIYVHAELDYTFKWDPYNST